MSFYADAFGGSTQLHTFAEFNRTDGPADAIAHGYLVDAPVVLLASDVAGDEPAFQARGLTFALLGTTDAGTLRRWFVRVAENGEVLEDLQKRPWGAFDGQVLGRYGLQWLIGFEDDAAG